MGTGLTLQAWAAYPPCCAAPDMCLFGLVWLVSQALPWRSPMRLSRLCRARWGGASGGHAPWAWCAQDPSSLSPNTVLPGWAFLGSFGVRGSCPSFELFLDFFPSHPLYTGPLREVLPLPALQMKNEHFVNEQTHPAPSACCLPREKLAKLLHIRMLKKKNDPWLENGE